MATIQPATPLSPTITPASVLNYGYQRGSRNVVLEPLGSGYPTVFLRDAQSRAGTLELLFTNSADSLEAEQTLSSADRFHFEEPVSGEEFHFVVTGAITRNKVEGVNYWTVSVEFREVEAL